MADLVRSSSSSAPPKLVSFITKAVTKRRTWVILFLLIYSLLLSSSWNLILSISISASSSLFSILRASIAYGAVFGLLSMAAAAAVAAPATVVTWITILVLLFFAGKPRRDLVAEGRRMTRDILRLVLVVLLREGNLVAGVCALASFFLLLVRRRRGSGQDLEEDL